MPVAMERLCDWVVNKDQVWVHGDRITDGHVALDMRAITGLDPHVVDRDGRWMIRKSNFPTWLGEDHPDLTDALPAAGPGWNQIAWSNWSTGGARIGAAAGLAVAVNHAWLSRLQDGYRIEHSPDHAVLRIVCVEPTPGLLTGPEPHHAVVGAVVPLRPSASPAVLQAIVQDLEQG